MYLAFKYLCPMTDTSPPSCDELANQLHLNVVESQITGILSIQKNERWYMHTKIDAKLRKWTKTKVLNTKIVVCNLVRCTRKLFRCVLSHRAIYSVEKKLLIQEFNELTTEQIEIKPQRTQKANDFTSSSPLQMDTPMQLPSYRLGNCRFGFCLPRHWNLMAHLAAEISCTHYKAL